MPAVLKSVPPQSADDHLTTVIAELAEAERRQLVLEEAEAEARKAEDQMATNYYESEQRHTYDALLTLQRVIGLYPAKTSDGAIVQLARAICEVDLLIDGLPEVAICYELKERRRGIDRLIFSALRYLEEVSNRSCEDIGLGAYRCRNLDPWVPVEDRIAAVRADLGGAK